MEQNHEKIFMQSVIKDESKIFYITIFKFIIPNI